MEKLILNLLFFIFLGLSLYFAGISIRSMSQRTLARLDKEKDQYISKSEFDEFAKNMSIKLDEITELVDETTELVKDIEQEK